MVKTGQFTIRCKGDRAISLKRQISLNEVAAEKKQNPFWSYSWLHVTNDNRYLYQTSWSLHSLTRFDI